MTISNLLALTFLPQEQIALAHSHEENELHRYRWLALTFLPFDPSVSRLMTAVGMECVHRLCNLQEVASKMGLGACLINNQPREVPLTKIKSQHFFVVGEPMGRELLSKAEEDARVSCTFLTGCWKPMLRLNFTTPYSTVQHRRLMSVECCKSVESNGS
ncbi:hypothetical protein [Halomonas sp. ISL-56]|uniref:hypothetical protein n=1 Tax=Halomonas sp. ISL-56 TaxID=2819149 RepID=UPI002035213A|nr:hypothetical protein [Halomonas sp. ISL-56]